MSCVDAFTQMTERSDQPVAANLDEISKAATKVAVSSGAITCRWVMTTDVRSNHLACDVIEIDYAKDGFDDVGAEQAADDFKWAMTCYVNDVQCSRGGLAEPLGRT